MALPGCQLVLCCCSVAEVLATPVPGVKSFPGEEEESKNAAGRAQLRCTRRALREGWRKINSKDGESAKKLIPSLKGMKTVFIYLSLWHRNTVLNSRQGRFPGWGFVSVQLDALLGSALAPLPGASNTEELTPAPHQCPPSPASRGRAGSWCLVPKPQVQVLPLNLWVRCEMAALQHLPSTSPPVPW